jgi:CubicO group peptidase (beta-lactamase class C family)
MKKACFLFVLFLASSTLTLSQKKTAKQKEDKPYFPPAQAWQHQLPQQSGFDTTRLKEAIRFAIEKESKQPRSMEVSHAMSFGKEPFGESVGPFADRGEPTGLIIRKGYIIAEWGEPKRVDMTHSVTKSFLSTVVGLAVDKGLIHSVNDTVANYVGPVEMYDPLQLNGQQKTSGNHNCSFRFHRHITEH